MSETFYVVPEEQHNALVTAAYKKRGYSGQEAAAGARFCAEATRHGIRTHNAIKALHLDEHFGSKAGGCVPGAEIEEIPSRFAASKIWNANLKLGQSTAFAAMEEAIRLADQYGIGQVSVDNAFHYLWGGGYVMDAAKKGYIAYTNERVHETLATGFEKSPMFAGRIKGLGPRYCPSIEDKIVRFADRDRHQIFLEPEGRTTLEYYCNGISTSLPRDVQDELIRSIKGLEHAEIMRYGYAVEYAGPAVRALPMWKKPVGLGAKRTRT